MPQTILIVDDAPHIRTLVSSYLEQEGFHTQTAANGKQALAQAEAAPPDLILLDIMMPEMGGYEFMQAYTSRHDTPIILLTARVEETDKVMGLELGADDYITKPFSMRELSARVKAVLRRFDKAQGKSHLLQHEDLILDRKARSVMRAGKRVDLTPTEFGLLEALMLQPGRALTRLELLNHIQGNSYEGYERTIDVHIRNLRTKIEPDPHQPRYIETVYGVGYRFSPDN
ncbi:MAG: response regulator transcription factor [Chloroflexi bacterium]|nr:response regulator transcription factor [Chloroflexota bacterium]